MPKGASLGAIIDTVTDAETYQQLGSKVVGQAGCTEVVPAGLNGYAIAQRAEADLALEVFQCASVSGRVS